MSLKRKLELFVAWLQTRTEKESIEAVSFLAKMEELGIIRRVYGTLNEWKVIE